MNRSAKWKVAAAALVAVGGMLTAACGSDSADGGSAGAEGVSSKPCKNAPTGSKERGCIYLGTITDLSGIFQPVGDTIAQAQQRFWDKVNADGGIGGKYDVDV